MPRLALATRTAVADQRDDHPCADSKVDIGAALGHPTHRFMPEHGGECPGPVSVDICKVAVTDRHGINDDTYLSDRARLE